MKKTLFRHASLVFLVGFIFVFSCYGGLPVDFNADHVNANIRGADEMSYSELIRLTLNPLTPAWFYPPNGLMEYLRPLQFLGMKLFFEFFDYSLIPFHAAAAFGSGMLMVFFLLIIFYLTRSLLLGWLGVLFYLSLPSNLFMMLSTFSLDFQYFISVLSITSLALFGFLTLKPLEKPVFFLAVLGWTVSVWIAIKLKSSEKVLPFVCLFFLILRFSDICKRIAKFRLLILFLGIIGMMALVIPFRPFDSWVKSGASNETSVQPLSEAGIQSIQPANEKDKQTFSFQWQNLFYRTFYVPGGEFPFTTIHRRKVPQSFTENYGFFMGWLFWIGLLLTPFLLAHLRNNPSDLTERRGWEVRHHFLWLALLWFGATIAGFANGLNVKDTRMLNFAYVPSILILFSIVGMFERTCCSTSKRQFWFRALILFFVLYTSLSNFSIFAKLLGHFGGIQDALVRAERDVYLSVYNESPNERTLYERHQELERRVVIIDWYDLPTNWLELVSKKLHEEGVVYFYTRTPDSEKLQKLGEAGYQVTFWKRYDFLDAKPLVFKLFKILDRFKGLVRKTKKENAVLVYQIKRSEVANEKS